MCHSDLNRKGKSTPMQFVTSGRHPYFILVDNMIFDSACMALGIKSRITKLKLLCLRTACKTASFSMVGKLRVNLYFTHHLTTVVKIQTFPWWGNQRKNLYFKPPQQIRPSEKYKRFHGRNGEGKIHILSTSWSIVQSQVGPVLKKICQMKYQD